MSERTLALGAVAISVLSALFAGWQSYLVYAHNRLTVMPKLDWRLEARTEKHVIRLRLINAGLGPAQVDAIEFTLEDEPLGPIDRAGCERLSAYLGLDASHALTSCWTFDVDDVVFMNTSETIVLFERRVDPAAPVDLDEAIVARLGVRARYCSFYGDCEIMD